MNWVPMTCPECGHDDMGDTETLRRARLVCEQCGAHMERDDGEDAEEVEA